MGRESKTEKNLRERNQTTLCIRTLEIRRRADVSHPHSIAASNLSFQEFDDDLFFDKMMKSVALLDSVPQDEDFVLVGNLSDFDDDDGHLGDNDSYDYCEDLSLSSSNHQTITSMSNPLQVVRENFFAEIPASSPTVQEPPQVCAKNDDDNVHNPVAIIDVYQQEESCQHSLTLPGQILIDAPPINAMDGPLALAPDNEQSTRNVSQNSQEKNYLPSSISVIQEFAHDIYKHRVSLSCSMEGDKIQASSDEDREIPRVLSLCDLPSRELRDLCSSCDSNNSCQTSTEEEKEQECHSSLRKRLKAKVKRRKQMRIARKAAVAAVAFSQLTLRASSTRPSSTPTSPSTTATSNGNNSPKRKSRTSNKKVANIATLSDGGKTCVGHQNYIQQISSSQSKQVC